VDKNRIGCCGLSIGGFRSAHLAALDRRIKCAAVAGWMPTMNSLLYDSLINHTYMVYIPGLSRFMDLPDVAGLTAPNYLFVQQCTQDRLYNLQGMQEACHHIERIYEKAGCADNYKYKFYDNDHEFNLQMQEDAFNWLETWLK
jgi:dienelactone hydrolase